MDTKIDLWRFIAFWAVALCPLCAISDDSQWGNLTGRFLCDGDPPPGKIYRVTKDKAAFGDTMVDGSMVVNRENGGIANVLVFLLPKAGSRLSVHPSYASTAKSKVDLVMKDGRFVPHILLLRTTQTMVQRSSDQVGHSAKIDLFRNQPM